MRIIVGCVGGVRVILNMVTKSGNVCETVSTTQASESKYIELE